MKQTQEHSSFGVIQLNRITTPSGIPLVGCHFNEPVYYELCVYRALYEEQKDCSTQVFRPILGELVVRLYVSEKQALQILLQSNRCECVPCTLERVGGQLMEPAIPMSIINKEDHVDSLADALRLKHARAVEQIAALKKVFEEANLSTKQKQKINMMISNIRNSLETDMEFYFEQYQQFLSRLHDELSLKNFEKEQKKTKRRS